MASTSAVMKRLFGTSIPEKARKILSNRQNIASSPQPNSELGDYAKYQTYQQNDLDGVGGMSSKTPFIRMWCSIEPVVKTDTGKTFSLDENSGATITSIKDAVELEGDGKFVQNKKSIIEFGKVYELLKNPKDYQIIMLGNNSYYDIFNVNNEFLKPQAGITGLTSDTQGNLGLLKRTEVSFKVFNFNEYQEIYQKYFLKPGALVFVDFGFNKVGDGTEDFPDSLYEPSELLKYEGNPADFLYGDPISEEKNDGWVDSTKGNVETVFGYVTNYDSKLNSDGSFDCKVEITSGNIAVNGSVSKSANNWIAEKLDELMDNFLIYSGKKIPEGLAEQFKMTYATKEMVNDAWWDWREDKLQTTIEQDDQEVEINHEWMNKQLKTIAGVSDHYYPNAHNIKFGFHTYQNHNWIQIGALEDLILNPLFGLGEDLNGTRDKTLPTKGVRFETSQETFWLQDHQHQAFDFWIYGAKPTDIPVLWPSARMKKGWRNTDDIDSFIKEARLRKNIQKGENAISNQDSMDISQLFVSFDIVKQAFNSTNTGKEGSLNIVKVYRNLVSMINEKLEYTNFKLIKNPQDDNIWEIVDINWLGSHVGENTEQLNTILGDYGIEKPEYKTLFEFDVTSPKSIVRDIDLGFKMPSDNISNMIAISGNSSGRGFSALNRLDDEAICTEIAHSFMDAGIINGESKVVDYYTDYKPILSTAHSDAFLQRQKNIKTNFQSALEEVFSQSIGDIFEKRNISRRLILNEDQLQALEQDKIGDRSKTNVWSTVHDITLVESDEIVNINALSEYTEEELEIAKHIQQYLEKEGTAVSGNIIEYYKKRLCNKIYNIHVPTALPMTLSITIDGISTLSYGQCFQVNYLPKTYKNKVFFQITKVTHTVSSSGWQTKLETQFRFDSKVKEVSSKSNVYLGHFLNTAFLRKQINDDISQITLPFHSMYKILPESSIYWGAIESISLKNQIVNYDGLYSFESRFDLSDDAKEGYKTKDNKPIIPDSIYNVIPPINQQWEDSILDIEYSMFLYGAVFPKDAVFSGAYTKNDEKRFSVLHKEYAKTTMAYDRSSSGGVNSADILSNLDYINQGGLYNVWNDAEEGVYKMTYTEMESILSQFPNFKIEPVENESGKRFIIADGSHRVGDDSGVVQVFEGKVGIKQGTGGGGTSTTDKSTMGGLSVSDAEYNANPLMDSNVIVFYPGIPTQQKQFTVVYQGKMVWAPFDQFMALSELDKRKALLAMHLFINQTKMQPAMLYDRQGQGSKFVSLVNGYTPAEDVIAHVYNKDGVQQFLP